MLHHGGAPRLVHAATGAVIASLAVVAVAGCGGSADVSGSNAAATSASAGAGGRQLALVAYSTPKPAYDRLIAQYEHTPAGKGEPGHGAPGATVTRCS